MNVYVYQSAFLCEVCGEKEKQALTKLGYAPKYPENEYSFDSDKYPKGPYPNGGGEADYPQHCDHCGIFLENQLTGDGNNYVIEAARFLLTDTVQLWLDFYSYLEYETE